MIECMNLVRDRGRLMLFIGIVNDRNGFTSHDVKYFALTDSQEKELADLVGKYVGWTAQTVQAKFREAKGGVLFIDEAYSLVEHHSGSFGDEAINTIVQEMENHREDVVVIFAGYPNEMEKFLQKNHQKNQQKSLLKNLM